MIMVVQGDMSYKHQTDLLRLSTSFQILKGSSRESFAACEWLLLHHIGS